MYMARTKQYPGQLQIDFLAAFRRTLISLGNANNLPQNEALFVRMTDEWDRKQVLPADLLFQKSPVEAVVYRLQKQAEATNNPLQLHFPPDLVAGELRGTPGLTGFSAMFREQGWIMLPAELSGTYKHLFLTILTASLGLQHHFADRRDLLAEAERVALASLLPTDEMAKFFGIKLSRFPDSFRQEVANYFNLPFEYVLKRALHLGVVSAEAVAEAANPRPARPNALRKPLSRAA